MNLSRTKFLVFLIDFCRFHVDEYGLEWPPQEIGTDATKPCEDVRTTHGKNAFKGKRIIEGQK